MGEQLASFDPRLQLRVEPQHAVEAQHVRDEVVGEGGEPFYRLAWSDRRRGSRAVEVGRRYLGTLVEGNRRSS